MFNIFLNVFFNFEKASPVWNIKPSDSEEEIEKSIKFRCEAFAKPSPIYLWTKNGQALNNDRYSINPQGNELTISSLKIEDIARYSCIAENFKGRIEAFFKLNVLGKI